MYNSHKNTYEFCLVTYSPVSCVLLWLVYLIGGTLLYLCLIIYNSITCGCASCSAHRKLLEGYVGSGPCATRHLLSTSYQHNIIDSGHTCLTCVPAVIVIMYTAGQIIGSQAWLMILSSNWIVTPVYYVYSKAATCMAPERPRVPGWASKSSLSIVLLYLAKCSLNCTALPLLLKLCDVRNRLPHVFCSWVELPVLCVIIASHLYVRQSEKTHGTDTIKLLPAITSGQCWRSCHQNHQEIPLQ